MKIIFLALAVLTVCASASSSRPGWPFRSTGPTFPKPPRQPQRFRRELTGSIGVVKYPGRNPEPTVEIQGHWRFRRDTNQEGSIYEVATHPLSGSDPQSTLDSGYQPEVYEGNHRFIRASGHKVKSTKGVKGLWRFRRETDDFAVEPETLSRKEEQTRHSDSVLLVRREVNPEGSIPETAIHRLGGPEPQSTLDSDYQPEVYEGNHRFIRASGHKVKSTKGVKGLWRFRREADDFAVEPETLSRKEEQTRHSDSVLLVRREVNPEGSIPETAIHRLGGPEPQSTLDSDYQPEIYEENHRFIRASGHKVKTTKGVKGLWRFRREAGVFTVEPETLLEEEHARSGDSVLQSD